MRFTALEVNNIGGLQDFRVEIPRVPIYALAGANGTGKTKFLACLLAPWTMTFPSVRDAALPGKISVSVSLDSGEIETLQQFASQAGYHLAPLAATDVLTATLTRQPLTGQLLYTSDQFPGFPSAVQDSQFLAAVPTLDLVYLPAERRFITQGDRQQVDLNELTDAIEFQRRGQSRAAAAAGRLDDGDFESYGKALCVASNLPSEAGDPDSAAASKWDSFKEAVDILLFPKFLMPLTRENPSSLRIGLSGGGFHTLAELSSGERQALVIISRVFRASDAERTIVIDEPDAYLHPALSSKLLSALRIGLKETGQLIVATHSPAVLDAVPPESILRLYHDRKPEPLANEGGRLDLYRAAGFKASTLTQANLLIVAEGEFDQHILPKLAPELASAGIVGAGGRAEVVRRLTSLNPYDLPIFGVVDADVMGDAIPEKLEQICHIWPAADIEGVLLSSDSFLSAAIDGALVRQEYRDLETLKRVLAELLAGMRDSAIAEIAQRHIRLNDPFKWPSPRGEDPLGDLRSAADDAPRLPLDKVDAAIEHATRIWGACEVPQWAIVRGKWILGKFTSKVSNMRSKEDFIEAVIARKPDIPAVRDFASRAKEVMLR